MSSRRSHYYMATALIGFIRDDQPKQRYMNIVMQSTDRSITAASINDARLALITRLHTEIQIQVEDIKDFVFLGFSYLGHMSEREFQGEAASRMPATPSPYDA